MKVRCEGYVTQFGRLKGGDRRLRERSDTETAGSSYISLLVLGRFLAHPIPPRQAGFYQGTNM